MIYLLWPTARPKMFLQAHKCWIDTASDPKNIKTMVAVDSNEEKAILSDFSVIVVDKDHPGVAYVAYELTRNIKAKNKDIIILASDDFYPPQNWDKWLNKQLSNFDGCLLIRDGYQTGGCVTLPIMTYSCLLKLNKIIYHPSYRHQYSDAELYSILADLKLVKNFRDKQYPLFEHRHWANGKRQMDSIDAKCANVGGYDHKNYKNRQRLSTQQKLKV